MISPTTHRPDGPTARLASTARRDPTERCPTSATPHRPPRLDGSAGPSATTRRSLPACEVRRRPSYSSAAEPPTRCPGRRRPRRASADTGAARPVSARRRGGSLAASVAVPHPPALRAQSPHDGRAVGLTLVAHGNAERPQTFIRPRPAHAAGSVKCRLPCRRLLCSSFWSPGRKPRSQIPTLRARRSALRRPRRRNALAPQTPRGIGTLRCSPRCRSAAGAQGPARTAAVRQVLARPGTRRVPISRRAAGGGFRRPPLASGSLRPSSPTALGQGRGLLARLGLRPRRLRGGRRSAPLAGSARRARSAPAARAAARYRVPPGRGGFTAGGLGAEAPAGRCGPAVASGQPAGLPPSSLQGRSHADAVPPVRSP
jgi:hypothetical protein